MPGTYTYPGVYVEELPSGVRTIAGVSTSDTAFVDFFPRGPVGRAVRVTSMEDFERRFGGLHRDSPASYAIAQYYANGGSIAWVVRVARDAVSAQVVLEAGSPPGDSLTLEARDPGLWGYGLQIGVDHRALERNLIIDPVGVLLDRAAVMLDGGVPITGPGSAFTPSKRSGGGATSDERRDDHHRKHPQARRGTKSSMHHCPVRRIDCRPCPSMWDSSTISGLTRSTR